MLNICKTTPPPLYGNNTNPTFSPAGGDFSYQLLGKVGRKDRIATKEELQKEMEKLQ